MKELVREKKLNIWREVVEKAKTDFDGNKKEFWAFVSRRTKGKRKKNTPSLKSEAEVSVTSTRGKLEVLQRHYQQLGKLSLDRRKRLRVMRVDTAACQSCAKDNEIEKGEIVKCIRKLKNSKTGGGDGLVGELLK